MKSHDEPIPIKKTEKGRIRKPRVTNIMQTHQRIDAILDLIV